MAADQELKTSFDKYISEAEEARFSGWDFGYLARTGRMVEAPLNWNYYNIVLSRISKAETLLDMGTGGGEFLSEFDQLPPVTFATEQYLPNVDIARNRLEPLGVMVKYIEEEPSPPYNSILPFEDDFFDLIINRHEAYYPPELMRILKPGGVFVTQQVGGANFTDLVEFLAGEKPKTVNWTLKSAAAELESAGFEIILRQEDILHYRFYDIGAIVYLLNAIPWTIRDFSVGKYRDKLWQLHVRINEGGYLDSTMHRFVIAARKK